MTAHIRDRATGSEGQAAFTLFSHPTELHTINGKSAAVGFFISFGHSEASDVEVLHFKKLRQVLFFPFFFFSSCPIRSQA